MALHGNHPKDDSARDENGSPNRVLTRRELLCRTAVGAAGLTLGSGAYAMPAAARARRFGLQDLPAMGAPGTGLNADSGPGPRIHRADALPSLRQGGVGAQDLGNITNQLWGTGLYIGNEYRNWSDQTRFNVFAQIAGWGFDFVCPKVGGYGLTWHGSWDQLISWRDAAHSAGIGFVPFIYSIPSTYYRDAQICSQLVNACGICVVDMEDEWAYHYNEMAAFGSVFRSYNPSDPIIVTGYGDPITRFGRGVFPSAQMTAWADGYSPQWYYGVWSIYNRSGVVAAINWADNECGIDIGWSYPMCPSLSIYTIFNGRRILPVQDITTGEQYSRNWMAPIFWWEYSDMNDQIAAACLS